MRVLLVEDDVRMAAAMHRALRGAGVVADVASTSEEAAWMVREVNYDAMVLDVMLPDTDGFETCRVLRTSGVWLPIIMVTARDAIEDRVRGLDAGADDYLTKPFSHSSPSFLPRQRVQTLRATAHPARRSATRPRHALLPRLPMPQRAQPSNGQSRGAAPTAARAARRRATASMSSVPRSPIQLRSPIHCSLLPRSTRSCCSAKWTASRSGRRQP